MPGEQELDDDLGVEVEVVGVELERHRHERGDRVDAVTGVELAERGAQHPVLEPGQDAVADELVERHAAAARAALFEHPRAEDGVGSPLAQRTHEIGQALGRVLAVAVHQRHEVEAVLNREVVADLLVAAVALVDRVEEHVQRKRQRALPMHPARALEGPILRRVVEHQHLDVVLVGERARHAREHLADRLLRVVGDDEDEQARLTQGTARRRTVPP